MELKINYQYTYFIHPYQIKDGKIKQYILKMLKTKNIKLKNFEKEKDIRLFKYLTKKTRENFFSSFSYTNEKLKYLEELSVDTRAALLAENECNIFEYEINNNIQGKIDNLQGIFFAIEKIQIICFKNGISFFVIKTDLGNEKTFKNILNFNYKFRDINNKQSNLSDIDNIRLQKNEFSDTEQFRSFIKYITELDEKDDIDIEEQQRLYTFSYTCIDQEHWNANKQFEEIKEQFTKYANLKPVDSSLNHAYEELNIFSKWKYTKIAITNKSVMLMTSSIEIENYTNLPHEFENEYLYTYILNIYKKITMKNILDDIHRKHNVEKAIDKYIELSKKLYSDDITDEENGDIFSEKLVGEFKFKQIEKDIKDQYDIFCKKNDNKKTKRSVKAIALLLVVTLTFNIINFLMINK